MAPPKDEFFLVLLRYAEAASHKLIAKHVATATGLALSTSFAKIAKVKELLAAAENNKTQFTANEAFKILLAYADAAGHKLSAAHAATAANIALSTAFAKISAAREATGNNDTPEEKPAKQSARGSKRKLSPGTEQSVDGDSAATVVRRKAKPTLKAKVKSEECELTPVREILA